MRDLNPVETKAHEFYSMCREQDGVLGIEQIRYWNDEILALEARIRLLEQEGFEIYEAASDFYNDSENADDLRLGWAIERWRAVLSGVRLEYISPTPAPKEEEA